MRSYLDYKKVKRELDWQSEYCLDKGLLATVNWFKEKDASL